MEHEKTDHRPLGFRETGRRWDYKFIGVVDAGATADFIAIPQLACVGERLHVQMACAQYFEIQDIRCGQISMMTSADPIPADTYAIVLDDEGKPQRHQDNRIDFPIAAPGQVLTIKVRNKTTEAREFSAALLVRGIVSDDWEPPRCPKCGEKQPRR